MSDNKGSDDNDLESGDESPVESRPAVALLRDQDENFSDDPLSATGEFDTTGLRALHAASATDEADGAVVPAAAGMHRLENDLAELTSRWNEVESLLSGLVEANTQTDVLRQALAAAERGAQSAVAALDDGRARIHALEESLSALSAQHTELEQAYAEQREALQAARSQRDAALAEAAALAATHGDLGVETGSAAVLVCYTDDGETRYRLDQRVTTIGRGADCHVRVATSLASRLHAAIIREDGGYVIEDRGSTNGLYVNSRHIERVKLRHGDWITLGEMQFRYEHEADE